MRVVAIKEAAELQNLREHWVALWSRCPEAGPFQHPDWLLAWWRNFGGSGLWCLAIYNGNALAAVAPFFLYSTAPHRGRQLTLLGNGISDSCDVLLDRNAPESASALFDYVASQEKEWDCADFRDIPAGSVLLSGMADRFATKIMQDSTCPVLDLAHTGPDLAGSASARLLSNLRYCQRRASALGGIRIQSAAARTICQSLDALFNLHARRWSDRGEAGVLSHASIKAFHTEVAHSFFAQGWLRLYLLYLQDDIAAVNYGFLVRQRCYFYIGGFDPQFAKISPGNLLIKHAITEAVREGARQFDFLRGDEAYKYGWGAHDRHQYRIQISRA